MIGRERTDLAVIDGGPPVPADAVDARDHRAVDDRDPEAAAPARRSPLSTIWNAPLIVHVLVLVAVLVGIVAATSQPDSFTTDEGSYEIQLRALEQGSWTWSSGTEALDPDGTHYPIAYSSQTEDGRWVPLVKHPLWPWAAAQVARVSGADHAYDVIGSLAVVLTALAAWFLAAARAPSLKRGAFWLAGLAPVTVTATFGWAHAASAAAAGAAVLGAVWLVPPDGSVDRRRAAWAAALVAVGVAGGILLRTEGLLFAIALAVALGVAGRQVGRSWGWSIGSGAGVLVWAALVLKLEDLWVRSITGSGSATLTPRTGGGVESSGFLDARYQGAVRSLLDVNGGGTAVVVFVAVLATAVAAAFVVRGERRAVRPWQAGMGLIAAAFFFRVALLPDLTVRGIFIAWPILIVGAVAAGSWLWRKLVLESTVVVLFAGAILATQYADGGAIQWGGRFFAPLVVPLAVVVAIGLHRVLEAEEATVGPRPADAMPVSRALIGAVVVLPLVLGVWLCANYRQVVSDIVSEVDTHIEGVAITSDAQLPRMMWRYDEPWLVVDLEADPGSLTDLLTQLHEQADGPDQVSVLVQRYDLGHHPESLEDLGGWTEVDRTDVNAVTVIHLER